MSICSLFYRNTRGKRDRKLFHKAHVIAFLAKVLHSRHKRGIIFKVSNINEAKEYDVYILSANTTPTVLPNTGSGELFTVMTVITLAIAAAVVVTTVARMVAKKHYAA